jgi:ribosomal-protein-alanine N-acetyltransferase
MGSPSHVPSIVTDHLELVSLSPSFIEAVLARSVPEGSPVPPREWVQEDEWLLRLRLAEMERDPSLQEWLLRAIVFRGHREMLGHIGFHGRPEPARGAEIGYTVFTQHRRRGFATEAAHGLLRWAHREHGVHRFVASVGPTNEPSLGLVRKLGFVHVGRQWDERDGEELVFELAMGTGGGRGDRAGK